MATRRVLILGGAAVIVAALLVVPLTLTRSSDRTSGSSVEQTQSHAPVHAERPPTLTEPDQPPPLPPPDYKPAPRQDRQARTPDEDLAKKQQGVELLDRTITRLEGELAAAENAGDAETAKSLAIRIKRMREAREKQATDLEPK